MRCSTGLWRAWAGFSRPRTWKRLVSRRRAVLRRSSRGTRATAAALEESLDALRPGGDVAGVLRAHPAQREELMSLLQTSLRLQALDLPPPDRRARLRSRNRMLALAEQRRLAAHPVRTALHSLWSRRAVQLGSALALAGGLMGGAVTASADSMPGQPLYAIKPAVEQVELAPTWDPAANSRPRPSFAPPPP